MREMDTHVGAMPELPLQDAEAQLPALVEAAVAGMPSMITRDGEPLAVLVSVADWRRLSARLPTFVEHLLAFPLGEEDQHLFERDRRPWMPPEV